MTYFIATVLSKGKKEEFGFYADDRKHASELTKLKHAGIVIKITEADEPFDVRVKRIKNELFKNVQKKENKTR